MSQSGGAAPQRDSTLAAVLQLWGKVFDGLAAEPTRPGDWPAVAGTVGGYLAGGGGELIRAAQLRERLRAWLRLRPGTVGESAELEFETFLVSWLLSARPDAVRRWEDLELPLRMDPAAHIARAIGWDADKPVAADAVRYPYLEGKDLHPGGRAGDLVTGAVAELLNSGAAWWEPKRSRFTHDMRQRLTPMLAHQLHLFDGGVEDGGATPTEELTRLAFTIAVGAELHAYVSRCGDSASDADEAVRALAADVLPSWSDPPARRQLLQLSVDYELLGDMTGGSACDELGARFSDFRAVFRTFTEKARYFRETSPTAQLPNVPGSAVASRQLSILLELAIADVLRYRTDTDISLDDVIADLIAEVLDARKRQRESAEMLDILRGLRTPGPDRPVRDGPRETSFTFLDQLLKRLATDQQFGAAIPPGRAPTPAANGDVERLVELATRYLAGDRRPDSLLAEFATTLPSVVTALAPGNDPALPVESPADARWRLLRASGDALARLPITMDSLTVANSFAELGWVVANERAPADMRAVNDQVYRELRKVTTGPVALDAAGPLTRIARARPLADSKKANFDVAQQAAHESVMYGSRALEAAMRDPAPQVHRIVAALTGLQLSLLQAGGVFVRSAETELILPLRYSSNERRREHARYICDLATSAYTYTNLAIARLQDLHGVVEAGIVEESDINYPTTAAASTAAMGMRTLLLWATMHLAYPRDAYPAELPGNVKTLIPSIPGYFRQMLALQHLTPLNFADLTRIAMHYAFLSGDFRHPAQGAATVHDATPEHLRPGRGQLDLASCEAYLRDNAFDAGILDVIEPDRVRHLLDEACGGRYGEWRSSYVNPVRRSPTRFTRGELDYASIALLDATISR